MTLKLNYKHWWEQIGSMGLDERVKNLLKALVASHYDNAVPPVISDSEVKAFKESGIDSLEVFGEKVEYFEIVVFIPHDKRTHRQFAYLVRYYSPIYGATKSILKTPHGCKHSWSAVRMTGRRQWTRRCKKCEIKQTTQVTVPHGNRYRPSFAKLS